MSQQVATEVPTAVLPESDPLPGYLTREALARKLGLSTRTLDRMHSERSGPPRIAPARPGAVRSKLILYKLEDVTALLDSAAIRPCRTRASRRGVSR
jgi:hypothetical protein